MATAESTSVEARAAAMLQNAERRCKSPDDPAQLLAGLVHEVSELAGCQAVTVWDVRSGGATALLTIGGDGTPLALPKPYDNAASAAVRTANCLAEASVVSGLQLVLAVSSDRVVSGELLTMLADVLADLYRRELLTRLVRFGDRQAGILALASTIYAGNDRERIINIFATDGAAVLGAERIAVASRGAGQSWLLSAATAVTDPEQRSDAVQSLTRLVSEAASDGLRKSDGSDSADTERSTIVRPLSPNGEWPAATDAAVIQFGRVPSPADSQAAELLCRQVATALETRRQFESLRPAAQLRNAVRCLFARRMLTVVVVFGLPLLWLLFGQAELRIEAFGKATPTERQYVFAPEGGVITEVAVADQQGVQRGEVLCQIRNDELQILKERLQGELSAARTRLAALETMPRSSAISVSESGLPVSAEKEELKQRILGLERQKAIVDVQLETLTVRAPITGTVHRERIAELLTGRPVQKGQLLLEIANQNGPWELRLRIPEADIRHVVAARQVSAEPLVVSFVLETAPQDIHRSHIKSVADSTDVDETGGLSTLATADIPTSTFSDRLRPGSGVVAKIECGPARAGYVYFRGIIEFLERRLLL